MTPTKKSSNLFMSYSSKTDFTHCPRFYYWKRIRKLERPKFNIHFLIGRVVHEGVYEVIKKSEDAIKLMLKKYSEEVKEARKLYPELSVDDEQSLVFWRAGVIGMVKAFKSKYFMSLKKMKLVGNETPLVYQATPNLTIVGKLDNIISEDKRWKVHELKTAKGIDEQRIMNVRTDGQTSLYHTIFNLLFKTGKKLQGIVYDIIKKPSIRQKQNESKKEFMERLGGWYESTEGGIKFHRERLDKPVIDGREELNTLIQVGKQIQNCHSKEDYFMNTDYCVHDWGKCEFYEPCHLGGETKENMRFYTTRKPYKVVQ